MESRYLYHPESRDDHYQSLMQEEQCLHSRNLNALLDVDKEDTRFDFLRDHVSQCDKCHKQFDELFFQRERMNSLIPFTSASSEGQVEMEAELNTFISKVEASIIREKKVSSKKKIEFIKLASKDLLLSFFSFTTIKGLALATIAIITLKFVL